jgi:hypothetical protein
LFVVKQKVAMKRKEPTGTPAEDEGSPLLLRVEEQQEEHASNLLTALPDLALSAVLDFLQQEEGAPTIRVDGMYGLFVCSKRE